MTPEEARHRFASTRVAHLATVTADGHPHLVPVVFAVDGDSVYSAVDAKPKRTTALRRLDNVAHHPQVALLVDHYDDRDWGALWWVRADGEARVLTPETAEATHAHALLVKRYVQYRDQPPPGPVLAVTVTRWSGWSASPS